MRQATLTLFRNLPPEAWPRRGTANGKPLSTRAVAYIIAGHERHHLQTLRDTVRDLVGVEAAAPRPAAAELEVRFVHHAGDRCRRAITRLACKLTRREPRRLVPHSRGQAGIEMGKLGFETGLAAGVHSGPRSGGIC